MTVTDALVQTIIDITRGQAPREESPRRPWAAQLSNALRPHAEERLVTRMLTKIAVASEVPANARFVTDVLRSTNDLDLARIFAETAEADAHRPWQQRRISALKTRKPSTRTFGPRTCHTVYLDHGGAHGDGEPPLPVESWFRTWLPSLGESPVGLLPDPLVVNCASEFRRENLSELLLLLSCLPVAPVLTFDTEETVAQTRAVLLKTDLPWGWTYQPIVVTVRQTRDCLCPVDVVGETGMEDASAVPSMFLSADELHGVALAASCVWLVDALALAERVNFLVQALTREAGHLLPRSGRSRLFVALVSRRHTSATRACVSQALAGALQDNGYFDEALGLLESVPPEAANRRYVPEMVRALYGVADFQRLAEGNWEEAESSPEAKQLHEGRAAWELLRQLDSCEPTLEPPKPDATLGKVVSILHASQPVQNGGYANRAHQLLSGMVEQGLEVVAFTRPGFPEPDNDLDPGETAPAAHDGVDYRRIGVGRARKRGEYQYMLESLQWYRQMLQAEKPSVVHLRSTYVSALPGLIAARGLGIPAVYEVSGMWELVYAAAESPRMEGRRARTIVLEDAVLRHADAVTTLTEAMARIVTERAGVVTPPTVLPNAVNPERFAPAPRDGTVIAELGWPTDLPVVGYAGSFVDYEGLDILVDALAMLRDRGVAFRALLIGDGATHSSVVFRAQERNLTDWVHFTGRVPHHEVDRYYRAIDMCAYPRRLTPATAAVSPLKPFEAMAAKKTVLVSDVPPLAEIAGDQERAVIFAHDDALSLSEALERAIRDPAASEQRRTSARAWVERERSWNAVVSSLKHVLEETARKGNNSHG